MLLILAIVGILIFVSPVVLLVKSIKREILKER
jgi:hypothetical protein